MYGTLLPDSRTLFFHFLSLCYLWVWMEAALFGQLFLKASCGNLKELAKPAGLW